MMTNSPFSVESYMAGISPLPDINPSEGILERMAQNPINQAPSVDTPRGALANKKLAGDINSLLNPQAVVYATGAGGTVTQNFTKATAVALNKTCGKITMHAANLAAATAVSFTLTNSTIAATDLVKVVIASAATAGAYLVTVDAIAAGSCRISIYNISGGPLAEAIVLNFAVINAVQA